MGKGRGREGGSKTQGRKGGDEETKEDYVKSTIMMRKREGGCVDGGTTV